MLFSIIVPVYNVEKYVAECIESVIAQTYPDWELILVDDGSTDSSGKICKEYADKYKNVRVYYKENTGQSDSRNQGVEKAMGEYMLFLDSDDYIAPNTLQCLKAECDKWNNPDVIISEGMFEIYGNVLGGYKHWKTEDYPGLDGRETLLRTMKTAPNWSPCGKCYRIEFWRDHGFFFLTKRLAEDFELIDKVVLEASCVSMVPSFYYYRKFRPESTMTKPNKKLKMDMLFNMGEWEKYFQAKNLDSELVTAFRSIFCNLYCHDALGYAYLFKGEEKRQYFRLLDKYSFYLGYGKKRDAKLVRASVKIIGMRATCFLLGIIKRVRIKNIRKQCN